MDSQNQITIDIPFIAPSLNEFYANANPYFRSSLVKRLKNDVQWLLLSKGFKQKCFPFGRSKVDIFVTVCFADKKHRDVDNYFPKPIIDALKGFLIIDDDERYINCLLHNIITQYCKTNSPILQYVFPHYCKKDIAYF